MKTTVTFVTYDKAPNLTADDITAVEPLRKRGIDVRAAVWNDPTVNWDGTTAIIIRSPWDYYLDIGGFTGWLDRIEALGIPVWNPLPVLRWNINKHYLEDLRAEGVPIPHTVWCEQGTKADLTSVLKTAGLSEAVVKPIISASGHRTFRTSPESASLHQKEFDEIVHSSGAIVQEYLHGVRDEGEWSFLFFGGRFSHTVLKKPASHEFRVQEEHGGEYFSELPDKDLIRQAEDIVRRVNYPLLYARADGINVNGTLVLIELELVEPQLFLPFHPEGAERFANAVAESLRNSEAAIPLAGWTPLRKLKSPPQK